MQEDILELSAIVPERPQARLRTLGDPEGTLYELAIPEEFGSVALRRLGLKFQEVQELMGKSTLSVAQEKRAESLLNEVCGVLVIDAPAEAIAALPGLTKQGLATRFFGLTGEFMMESGLLPESILENLRRASSDSTEETPDAG